MSVQQRRKYDPDFKRNAVQLTEEPGRTMSGVAENLGISIFFTGGGERNVSTKSLPFLATVVKH